MDTLVVELVRIAAIAGAVYGGIRADLASMHQRVKRLEDARERDLERQLQQKGA